jgi:hypothetical protein
MAEKYILIIVEAEYGGIEKEREAASLISL